VLPENPVQTKRVSHRIFLFVALSAQASPASARPAGVPRVRCAGRMAVGQVAVISLASWQLRTDSCLSALFLCHHYRAARDPPDLKKIFFPSQEHNKPLSKQSVVYSDECR